MMTCLMVDVLLHKKSQVTACDLSMKHQREVLNLNVQLFSVIKIVMLHVARLDSTIGENVLKIYFW